MQKKLFIIGIIAVIILVIVIGIVIYFNQTDETYTPEKEIENVDLRKTIISLYFQDKESKSLKIETRLIDSKNLLKTPYKTLVEMLTKGPENNMFETIIPNDTRVISAELQGSCVVLNLSKEFLNNSGDSIQKSNSIYQIVNTLTELKEVSSVKFLIEGEESDGFTQDGISLKNEFVPIV